MKKLILAIIMAATSAHAQQFTADQICDLLMDSTTNNAIHMFIDAKDTNTSLKHKKFYTFKVTTEEKLGEFFGMKKSSDNSDYQMTQNGLTYNFKQYSFGRMLTQIEHIPAVIEESSDSNTEISPDGSVPTKVTYYWNIYKLCKSATCSNPDKSTVGKGDWHLTTGFDDQMISNQDVYYFIYPGKKPVKVNCVD